MPTDLPADKPKPPRRRWWRRFFFAAAFLVLVLGLAAFIATRHLAHFAKLALERAFPGATVEIHRLDLILPNRLDIESLTLKSRRDGETLLSLAGGNISFSFEDLWNRRIGEVRLVQPAIFASPRLTEAFIRPAGPAPPKTTGVPWSVRRLVCDYGELTVAGYGSPQLALQTKFAFDFRHFSPGAPAESHKFALWDFVAATDGDEPFLRLDLLTIGFTLDGLFKDRVVDKLDFQGGSLIVGKSLRELFTAPRDPSAQPRQPWILRMLDIARVKVRLDDENPEISDITFALNTELRNLPLAQTAHALGEEDQVIEVRNLDILSPYDPFTKVITTEVVYFHFTLAGLLRGEIADLTIKTPVIHVGPDLFWYMEEMQRRFGTAGAPKPPSEPGWKIERLFIVQGEILLGSGGRKKYGLPLNFYANAQDVSLDNLASLKAQTTLEIPPQQYSFPAYQLEFSTEVGGNLRFSYPPEKGERNLVGDVKIKDIRWRQYRAADCYVSVTFDQKGINGIFGGKAYRGDAGGGFSFFFDPESPWIGWVYGQKIDLKRLTDIISPQNFQMTGPLDFRLQMDAMGRSIERMSGDIKAPRPGRMVIRKLDDMLANIPPDWNLLKKSSMRIMLGTLRDFEYTRGAGDFWFVRSQGILQLKLQGPHGSRNFEIVLHADDSPEGRWKQRSANR